MCKYCKNLFSGKFNEELIDYPIIESGKYYALGTEIYIYDECEVNKVFIVSRTYDSQGGTVKEKKIKIKYCPMCGRKFNKG